MALIEHERPGAPEEERVQIRFQIENEDLADGEVLWAVPGATGFQLDNVPLLVFGLSLGDLVEGRDSADGLHFARVVGRGGHSTYRLMLEDPEHAPTQELFHRVVDLGCGYEQLSVRYRAIDVPPEVDVYAVYDLLQQGLDQGLWTFEEGHCGHTLRS